MKDRLPVSQRAEITNAIITQLPKLDGAWLEWTPEPYGASLTLDLHEDHAWRLYVSAQLGEGYVAQRSGCLRSDRREEATGDASDMRMRLSRWLADFSGLKDRISQVRDLAVRPGWAFQASGQGNSPYAVRNFTYPDAPERHAYLAVFPHWDRRTPYEATVSLPATAGPEDNKRGSWEDVLDWALERETALDLPAKLRNASSAEQARKLIRATPHALDLTWLLDLGPARAEQLIETFCPDLV